MMAGRESRAIRARLSNRMRLRTTMRGTPVRLPKMRGLLTDLLRASARVPAIPLQRKMFLGRLIEARHGLADRPPWSAIFVKGYALTARDIGELRQAYLACPWPHLFRYDHSVANIAVERVYRDENTVFHLLIGQPAQYRIVDMERRIREAQTSPVDEIPGFRRAVRFASLPPPIRRLAIWLGLNTARHRSRFFGTFGVSTVAHAGAELLTVIWPLSTVLTYGEIGEDGSVDVRLVFDHRIADAATMARALVRLEATLNGPVADELLELPAAAAAPSNVTKIVR
jgi:hypothetical protein